MMTCLWCDESLAHITWNNLFAGPHNQFLCGLCESELEKINRLNRCETCDADSESKLCADCIFWDNNFQSNRPLIKNKSIFKYNHFLKEMITKWKYRGDYVLGYAFKRDFMTYFNQLFQHEKDLLIVPIPLSQERLRERGFNQSSLLASFLPHQTGEVLERIHTEKQAKKSRAERLNQLNPFVCKHKIKNPVVLVDDLYTTGATIYAAAEKLRENGCPKIFSFTLVRG